MLTLRKLKEIKMRKWNEQSRRVIAKEMVEKIYPSVPKHHNILSQIMDRSLNQDLDERMKREKGECV